MKKTGWIVVGLVAAAVLVALAFGSAGRCDNVSAMNCGGYGSAYTGRQ